MDHLDGNNQHNSSDNLWSLCETCHNWKTGYIDQGLIGRMERSVTDVASFERMMRDNRLADYIGPETAFCTVAQLRKLLVYYVYHHIRGGIEDDTIQH